MDDATVIFLHIPKTGGVTLSSVLTRQYARHSVHRFDATDLTATDRLRSLSPQELQSIKLIYGHMSFGLHALLLRPATYITLLRDPIERAISDYSFVRSNPLHPLHDAVKKMGFSDYIESAATGQLSNGQTRLLSGDCDGDRLGLPTRNPVSKKSLEIAKRNILDKFKVVGLQERFDESLVLMMKRLGWQRTPYYVKANTSPSKVRRSEISSQDIALIRRHNVLDIELYEFARSRFAEEVKTEGASFPRELRKLRVRNAIYRMGVFLTLDPRPSPNLRSSIGAILRKLRQDQAR